MDVSSRRIEQFLFAFLVLFLLSEANPSATAQRRKPPSGGRVAVVADERLAALRESPRLSARLLRRIGRGQFVAIRGRVIGADGVVFYRARINSRTTGWIQSQAVVIPSQQADEKRLFALVMAGSDFDRIVRARIFLAVFPRSAMRPAVLLVLGDAAEAAAGRLSMEAARRLKIPDVGGGDAPEFSYFLNYVGLDRYNRQGICFVFDKKAKRLHYNGAAWHEIVRRFPRSREAEAAQERLVQLASGG